MSGPAPTLRVQSPQLAADLLTLLGLPPSVRESFWELLEPNLAAELGDEVDARVSAFCQKHEVEPSELVPAVRGARTLFLSAAQADLGVAEVMAQLESLCPNEPVILQLLANCYGRALAGIRTEMVLSALGDFGPVLENVGLRLDCVPTSRHSPGTMVPIPMMTLHYRDGGEPRRLTLQLPPRALAALRHAIDALVR